MKNYLYQLILIQLILFSACSTSYESGFNHHKNKINIQFNERNLGYQYVHDSIFEMDAKKKIDSFDFTFLSQFLNKIKSRGYQINQDSSFQNIKLEDCLIDFSYGTPKLIKFTYDSFYVNQYATTLVCISNTAPSHLFSASFNRYQEFEIEPKNSLKNTLDPTKDWRETPHYYYHLKPINHKQAYIIARELSERAVNKLDSINEQNFIKNKPALAATRYKKNNPDPAINDFVNLVAIVAITLISILLNV